MDVTCFTNGRHGLHPAFQAAMSRRAGAFTLIELMITVAIVTVIAMIAVPAYSEHVERARVSKAITDILELNAQLERYYNDRFVYPESLTEIGAAGRLDPWGRPYQYLNVQSALSSKGGGDKPRKNKKEKPINSDFDLYSMGKDGESKAPLNAKPSRDDVVRANDGRFVDLASKYE